MQDDKHSSYNRFLVIEIYYKTNSFLVINLLLFTRRNRTYFFRNIKNQTRDPTEMQNLAHCVTGRWKPDLLPRARVHGGVSSLRGLPAAGARGGKCGCRRSSASPHTSVRVCLRWQALTIVADAEAPANELPAGGRPHKGATEPCPRAPRATAGCWAPPACPRKHEAVHVLGPCHGRPFAPRMFSISIIIYSGSWIFKWNIM